MSDMLIILLRSLKTNLHLIRNTTIRACAIIYFIYSPNLLLLHYTFLLLLLYVRRYICEYIQIHIDVSGVWVCCAFGCEKSIHNFKTIKKDYGSFYCSSLYIYIYNTHINISILYCTPIGTI